MKSIEFNEDAFIHSKTVFIDIDGVMWDYRNDQFNGIENEKMFQFLSFLHKNNINICFLTHGNWEKKHIEDHLKKIFEKHEKIPFNFQLINRDICDNIEYVKFIKECSENILQVYPESEENIEIINEQLACFPLYYPKNSIMSFICHYFNKKPEDCLLIDDQSYNINPILHKECLITEIYDGENLKTLNKLEYILLQYKQTFEGYQYAPLENSGQNPIKLIDVVQEKLKLNDAKTLLHLYPELKRKRKEDFVNIEPSQQEKKFKLESH